MLCTTGSDTYSDNTEEQHSSTSALEDAESDAAAVAQEAPEGPGSEVPITECYTPSCSYGGCRSGRHALVSCSWCMRSFHKRCLADYQDHMVYSCMECRRMPGLITELMSAVTKLRKSVAHLDKVNSDLSQQTERMQSYLRAWSIQMLNLVLRSQISARSLPVRTGKISNIQNHTLARPVSWAPPY